MSVSEKQAAAKSSEPQVGKLKRGAIGTGGVTFLVVSAAAPLTVIAGVAPLAILIAGPAAPTAYLIAGVALIIFAIGFIGSGVLAVPVLAAAGAAGMAGLLQKQWGFDRSVRKAPVFYAILIGSMVLGVILSLISINPIHLLVLSAVVNGIAAGPFLIVMMLISRDRRIMGRRRNGPLASTLGWITTAIMCVAGAYGIWFTIAGG